MKFIIELNKGVVPFYFGHSIEEYKSKYPFNFIEGEADESWDEYDFFADSIEIYVNKSDNRIEGIGCINNCYLNGMNLIGLDIDDFFIRYNFDKSESKFEMIFLTDEDQGVYDIGSSGLQLWVNSLNKIVTVFVSD